MDQNDLQKMLSIQLYTHPIVITSQCFFVEESLQVDLRRLIASHYYCTWYSSQLNDRWTMMDVKIRSHVTRWLCIIVTFMGQEINWPELFIRLLILDITEQFFIFFSIWTLWTGRTLQLPLIFLPYTTNPRFRIVSFNSVRIITVKEATTATTNRPWLPFDRRGEQIVPNGNLIV